MKLLRSRTAWFVTVALATMIPVAGRAEEGIVPPKSSTDADSHAALFAADERNAEALLTFEDAVPAPIQIEFIDLRTAWRLAGIQNPNINRARAATQEAQALEHRARLVWFPDLSAGANYRKHIGVYQSSFGQIRDVSMSSAFVGSGALAVGGNSPVVPGVRLATHTADALYEPLAARQFTASRQFDRRATQNSMLLETTVAYLELVAAENRMRAALQTLNDVGALYETTRAYAQTGQGRLGDAHRAEAELNLLLVELRRFEEDRAVRAAELSRGIHLDPTIQLQTPGGPLELLDIVDLQVGLPMLIEIAIRNRPELASRSMLIAQSQVRIRQEKARPFLPQMSIGYSAGGFGGTGNLTPAVAPFASLSNRADFDVWAVWTLRNLGAGNATTVDRFEAEAMRRSAERHQVRNQIQNEVGEAFAQAYSRRLQLAPALRRLELAQRAFDADYNRLRASEGLPLEALGSLRFLAAARQEIVAVVAADTIAQFRLYALLGRAPDRSMDGIQPQPVVRTDEQADREDIAAPLQSR